MYCATYVTVSVAPSLASSELVIFVSPPSADQPVNTMPDLAGAAAGVISVPGASFNVPSTSSPSINVMIIASTSSKFA